MRCISDIHMNKAALDPDFNGALQQERAQAVVRIIITSLVLGLLVVLALIQHDLIKTKRFHETIIIVIGYWGLACVWWLHLRRTRQSSARRRLLSIIADLGTTSLSMFLANYLGAFFYPLYQWIIIGHGVRFGSRAMLTAAGLSIIGFGLVIVFTPYWQQNLLAGMGLMVGLAVLPVYFLTLLRQLQHLNGQLREELEKTRHIARHDTLTALANRHQFYERLEEEIRRRRRHGGGFALMFIDLDGFKAINDELGHQAGDQLLQEVARRLHDSARETDLAARLGGDEFAMLIDNISTEQEVLEPALRIAAAINRPVALHGQLRPLSGSIGISLYPTHGTDTDSLTRNADLAMYAAKRQGKQRHIIFSKALGQTAS